jgi:hypothetical protein
MKLIYNGSKLEIDGTVVETPSPVREAFVAGRRIIVLMDHFADLKGPVLDIKAVRNAPKGTNLFCYSSDGILLWKAELPAENDAEDYYYRVSSRSPLVVNSFSSYRCEIDPVTGKIVRKTFFK